MGERKKWVFDIFVENYLKIKDLGKEVEGRVPDFSKEHKSYQNIIPEDIVSRRVVNPEFKPIQTISPIEYEVSYNEKYPSVQKMILNEGLRRVLPEVNSIEECVELYHNLPGYEERIETNGIHAIGLGENLEVDEHPLQKKTLEAISGILPNSNYFAHPVNYYVGGKFNVHGNVESELVEILSQAFEDMPVYNPNQNQENYPLWKQHTGRGMNYYFNVILPFMEQVTVLPFEDGMIGAGAFWEVEHIMGNGKKAYEINEFGIITPIKKLDCSRALSVEETRKRVYG